MTMKVNPFDSILGYCGSVEISERHHHHLLSYQANAGSNFSIQKDATQNYYLRTVRHLSTLGPPQSWSAEIQMLVGMLLKFFF
jgi:hypothetical protein